LFSVLVLFDSTPELLHRCQSQANAGEQQEQGE
jgi:hypothetical protein